MHLRKNSNFVVIFAVVSSSFDMKYTNKQKCVKMHEQQRKKYISIFF